MLDDYKTGLKERKLNLDDDFVKFFRFVEWLFQKSCKGVFIFISNNTYLDGITHRRMRERLLSAYSKVYILDLHGSARRREESPDGTHDENVFDIQQGVSISSFIKTSSQTKTAVFHYELWGSRTKSILFYCLKKYWTQNGTLWKMYIIKVAWEISFSLLQKHSIT